MDRDDFWDMTDWSLRVAEALDYAAEQRGNTLHYGMAHDCQRIERVPADSRREPPGLGGQQVGATTTEEGGHKNGS